MPRLYYGACVGALCFSFLRSVDLLLAPFRIRLSTFWKENRYEQLNLIHLNVSKHKYVDTYFMQKRIYVLMLLVLLTAFSLCAQGRYTVKGLVADKSAGDVVVGATVQLLSLPDSSFVSGAVADEVGSFHFDKVNRGKYAVKFSFIGFMTKYVDVDLASVKTRIVDLGAVMLEDDAHMLKEAVVTANAAKVQVSGDSLVYSASAYRVPEGSTLEALVKLLPGAKVDDDGNITLNGKPVKKYLLMVKSLKSATIIQCTIKGRFEESLVATFSKKPQHNINM